MGFVGLVALTPKGWGFRIENHREIFRSIFFDDLEEHLGETIDGVGGKTFRIGKVSNRVEGTKDIRRTIDQKKPWSLRHDRS
jgi:hypothetical protein